MKALKRVQLVCDRKTKRFHTDGADEQNSAPLRSFLDNKGTLKNKTVPNSSVSNSQVERRFKTVFATTKTALEAEPSLPNKPGYCSYACTDEIKKLTYFSIKRDGTLHPPPHTTMKLHDCATDTLNGSRGFLPYDQSGYIVNIIKFKKKLDRREVAANYLRVLSKYTYLVYRRDKKNTKSVRQDKFVLTLTKNNSDNNVPVQYTTTANTQKNDIENMLKTKQVLASDAIKDFQERSKRSKQAKHTNHKTLKTQSKPSAQLRRLAQGEETQFPKQDGEDISNVLQIEKIKR